MTEKPHADSPSVFSRHNFLAIYLPALIMSSTGGMLIPVMPLFAKSFGITYAMVGVVLAAKNLGTWAFDVPAGVLVRRWGHRPVLTLGAGITILCNIALYQIHDITMALAYLFVSGLGWALWTIARHSYIAEVTDTARRGRSIALLGGMGRG